MDDTLPITDWFVLAIIAIVVLYDVWVVIVHGRRGTVSHTIRVYAERYLWIAVIAGMLFGHWFF